MWFMNDPLNCSKLYSLNQEFNSVETKPFKMLILTIFLLTVCAEHSVNSFNYKSNKGAFINYVDGFFVFLPSPC